MMKIACWSGPRNISTALMRSWSSRKDSFVSDEPFYSYYLKKTGLKHPMHQEIINKYPSKLEDIIEYLLGPIPNEGRIWYQKHMAHHILDFNKIDFILSFNNTFLIRNPKYVIPSYKRKNRLKSHEELGYYQQVQLINFLEANNKNYTIIDSGRLLKTPREILKKWCKEVEIPFDENMLKWQKGHYPSDGIWGIHWYDNVINSNTFKNETTQNNDIYFEDEIYKICKNYYNRMLDFAL